MVTVFAPPLPRRLLKRTKIYAYCRKLALGQALPGELAWSTHGAARTTARASRPAASLAGLNDLNDPAAAGVCSRLSQSSLRIALWKP